MSTVMSMLFGFIFGHGVVMLILFHKWRREDMRDFGEDMAGNARWRLVYWIGTTLALAGAVVCRFLRF